MSRPITDVLRDINGGKFVEQMTEELADVVGAVRATGKKGSLTITLNFKKAKGLETAITTSYDFKAKAPEFEKPDALFFADNRNSLLTDNPEQKTIGFKAVEPEFGQVKEVVHTGTGEIRKLAAV
ncbi:MAG: hypothetical protein EPN60_15080 [Nevskiaceae bacterium]|nr:MAG: hypothetical protein EPN60_15080 [Nevskiaceae bacterium]